MHLAYAVGVETADDPAQLQMPLCNLLVNILTCILTTQPALNTENASLTKIHLLHKHVQQVCQVHAAIVAVHSHVSQIVLSVHSQQNH